MDVFSHDHKTTTPASESPLGLRVMTHYLLHFGSQMEDGRIFFQYHSLNKLKRVCNDMFIGIAGVLHANQPTQTHKTVCSYGFGLNLLLGGRERLYYYSLMQH